MTETRHTKSYRHQAALADWNLQRSAGFTIFGTLKLDRIDRESISTQTADKIVKRFWAKVDRTYYPSRSVKYGTRVQRLTYWQQGDWGNNHYHFLAKPPTDDPNSFIAVLTALWDGISPHTASASSWIQECASPEGAAVYLSHEVSIIGSDSLKPDLTHLAEPLGQPQDYQTAQQAQRILKAQMWHHAPPGLAGA
jgi:hypothetical protein